MGKKKHTRQVVLKQIRHKKNGKRREKVQTREEKSAAIARKRDRQEKTKRTASDTTDQRGSDTEEDPKARRFDFCLKKNLQIKLKTD